jgi:hypothetical protein
MIDAGLPCFYAPSLRAKNELGNRSAQGTSEPSPHELDHGKGLGGPLWQAAHFAVRLPV